MKAYQKPISALCILFLASFCCCAQTIVKKSLQEIMEGLPKPPDSLQYAMSIYGNASGDIPKDFSTALNDLNEIRESILKPLFDQFTVITSNNNFAKFTSEEQKMMREFKTLRTNWGDYVMYGFDKWIEYSPGIDKQFWTRINKPLSSNAQSYYQQLLQIEKSLEWQTFLEEAQDREKLVFRDSKLDEIEKQLTDALEAVPQKKVKFAEGSDVMVDITDPDKTIEVCKQFQPKVLRAYQQVYNEQYNWWRENFIRLKTASKKLDGLLHATDFGSNLTGNDEQLIPAIADVQVRIISLLHHLTHIGSKVINIAWQANMSKTTLEETINGLKKMPSQ